MKWVEGAGKEDNIRLESYVDSNKGKPLAGRSAYAYALFHTQLIEATRLKAFWQR